MCVCWQKLVLSFKNIFSKYQKIKRNDPRLNRGLSSNFWRLTNANQVKLMDECVMCREHYEVNNVYTMSKIRMQRSVKKVMLTVFKKMKGAITIDFLEKGATVNNVSYGQFFRQNLPYLLNDSPIYVRFCVCVWVRIYVYVCMWVCVCVCVCVCVYKYTYMWVCVCWYAYI